MILADYYKKDFYKQEIYRDELFVWIDNFDVKFDNICSYLDEFKNDQYASELSDKKLIKYLKKQYNALILRAV